MDQGTATYGGASNGEVFDDKLFDRAGVGGGNVNVVKTEGDIPWGFPTGKSCERFDDGWEKKEERAVGVGEGRRGQDQGHARHWQEESTQRKGRIPMPVHDDVGETSWSPTLPSARQAALLMRGAIR